MPGAEEGCWEEEHKPSKEVNKPLARHLFPRQLWYASPLEVLLGTKTTQNSLLSWICQACPGQHWHSRPNIELCWYSFKNKLLKGQLF